MGIMCVREDISYHGRGTDNSARVNGQQFDAVTLQSCYKYGPGHSLNIVKCLTPIPEECKFT